MSAVKNCLTCKWEPEWKDDIACNVRNGICKSPVSPGAFPRSIQVFPKNNWACIAEKHFRVTNCPFYKPKGVGMNTAAQCE